MSDPPSSATQTKPELSDEITRSIGSVWQRHAGGRPGAISTEIHGDVVKCVLNDAVSAIGAEPADDDADPDEPARSPNSTRYRNEAVAAISRLTGRKVLAIIPKRDKKTDVATETFILEPPRVVR